MTGRTTICRKADRQIAYQEKDCIRAEIIFTFPVEDGESYDEANDRLTNIFDDLGLEYEQEDCWFHRKE